MVVALRLALADMAREADLVYLGRADMDSPDIRAALVRIDGMSLTARTCLDLMDARGAK